MRFTACWIPAPAYSDFRKDVMKIKPEMNHGRWIVRCPKSPNHAVQVFPRMDNTIVCGVCYPDPDGSARRVPGALAHQMAEAAGNVHEIDWPHNLTDIEQALRFRPIENMNWFPDETLEQLEYENNIHGTGPNMPQVTVSGGN